MAPKDLISHYPLLFHMAEPNTWASIRERGLMSTTALLDLFEIKAAERFQIESCHRPALIDITHPKLGKATIRDQKPMSDRSLARALSGSGLTPQQWYQFLNKRVFFWLTEARLSTLLKARAYRDRVHTVLTIDTRALVESYADRILLSPMNSGCTIPFAHKRDLRVFRRIADYPFEERRSRGLDAIVELTVEHSVPDIARFTTAVDHRKSDQIIETIFRRSRE